MTDNRVFPNLTDYSEVRSTIVSVVYSLTKVFRIACLWPNPVSYTANGAHTLPHWREAHNFAMHASPPRNICQSR